MDEPKDFSHFCSNPKIQQWLKDAFQEEDVPSFDETPEFIEALKKIMNDNETAEKDAKVIIKAEKNMKDFYNEKAEEMQLVTNFIQLNSVTCRRVQSLASLAENMKLKEPTLTNFLLAMTDIEDKELMQAEKKLVTSHRMSVFSKKIMHTMKINEKLKRNLRSLNKVVNMQKTHEAGIAREIEYLKKKKGEVENRIQDCKKSLKEAGFSKDAKIHRSVVDGQAQNSLEEAGFSKDAEICHSVLDEQAQNSSEKAAFSKDAEIRHSVLVGQAQKLKDLEEHLKSLENKLQAYHSLEPTMGQTETAVKKKENELIQLEKDLQMLLQAFEAS